MGGEGFPPPKLPQYPGHAGELNVTASPFLLPLVPYSPQPVSFTVLPRSVRPYGMSTVPHQGAWITNSVSPPSPAHVLSLCAPPSTQVPYPPRTPYTVPVPSDIPGRRVPLPSSVTCTPPPTESLPSGMGGRPFRLSSLHWSTGLPYQTGRPRC